MQTILRLIQKSARFIDQNKYLILLISIILLAAILRIWGLSSRDAWYDEILTILQSQKSFSQITEEVRTPIHFYIVHIFSWFGTGTFALGMPSVIFGLASVYLLYALCKKIVGKNLGILAALLLAISPMHIEFSQEILYFSYYCFFSLLSLFLLVDFISSVREGKIKWLNFLLLIVVNGINVLTQMVAPVIIGIEIIFLVLFLPFQKKFLAQTKKYILPAFLLIAIFVISILTVGHGQYKDFFLKTVKIDTKTPIPLGYSLSSKIPTPLVFNKDFYIAMFSWYGIGGGWRFYLYFIFAVIGIISLLFRKNTKTILILLLLWITLPFLFLYLIRLGHWFEEKYFIFIMPVYLVLVAEGIIASSLTISQLAKIIPLKGKDYLRKTILALVQIAVLIFIVEAAINPIKTRTAFGFPFKGYVTYNWRKVYNYLKENVQKGDQVWLRKEGSLFLDYYFGKEGKSFLIEETLLATLTPEEYINLANKPNKNYFVTLNGFEDLFIYPIAEYESVTSRGSIIIFEGIKFKKESPVKIEPEKDGEWHYYDDFRTAQYISHAANWHNLITTYVSSPLNLKIPRFDGIYNELSPIDFDSAYIDYNFILPATEATVFYLKPEFSIDQGTVFKIMMGRNKENLQTIYEKDAERFDFFKPTLKISTTKNNEEKPNNIYFRFEFDYKKDAPQQIGGAQLKSFSLFNPLRDGTDPSKDYTIKKTEDNNYEYTYGAGLVVAKNNKWTRHTIQNEGWMQADPGWLIRQYGEKDQNPLVYKFNFDHFIKKMEINFQVDAHYTVPYEVSYSTNGTDWQLLKKFIKAESDDFNLDQLNTKVFFLKITAELPGTAMHLRDFSFKAETQ